MVNGAVVVAESFIHEGLMFPEVSTVLVLMVCNVPSANSVAL
ncbi:MAG: hypothetical protein A4E23_00937 [Methanomethylovorans sp. PtaU1.Bin073]|nr:MAG: hypothetical protein A4E23_00937 [Methanomethylovorans sp. PtaU1.Bin073]